MNPSGKMAWVTEPDPDSPGHTRRVIVYYVADASGELVRCTEAEYNHRFPSKLKQLLADEEPPSTTHGTTTWTNDQKVSEALAVHPDQVEEAQARADRHGISCRYTPRGDVVVPDRANWLKLLKIDGLHEKS